MGTGPEAPTGSAPYTLFALAANHPDLAWKIGLVYVSRPDAPIDSQLKLFLMPGIASKSADLQPDRRPWKPMRRKTSRPKLVKESRSAISSIRLPSEVQERSDCRRSTGWLRKPGRELKSGIVKLGRNLPINWK